MATYYKFCIVRFAPRDSRGESVNIGVIVFSDDNLDVRVRRPERIRVISAATDVAAVRSMIENLKELDSRFRASGTTSVEERLSSLQHLGPITISPPGTFLANDTSSYEARVSSIVKALVDPEPAPMRLRLKRSSLLSEIKKVFRNERVMAKKDETIDSHRIVPMYELDEGLVADLVLRNGRMHVVETVDVSNGEMPSRKALGEIGIASLVLERARMVFGVDDTRARLVYSASSHLEHITRPSLEAAANQGTELVNWASADDRQKFIYAIASQATPIQRSNKRPTSRFIYGNRDLPLK